MSDTKSPFYEIITHPEIKVLEIMWTGKPTSSEFRKGTIAMLEMIKSQNYSKVIMDMEKLTFSVTQEDHDWLKDYYVPEALASNLKSIGFVEPGFVNTLSIANILYPYFPESINFEIFDNFELASMWIINS